MPAIDQRKHEERIVRKVEKYFRSARADYSRRSTLDWSGLVSEIAKPLEDELAALAVLAYMQLGGELGVAGITRAMADQAAAEIVAERSRQVASQMARSAQAELAAGRPIEKVLSVSRIRTIATTQATQAISAAHRAVRIERFEIQAATGKTSQEIPKPPRQTPRRTGTGGKDRRVVDILDDLVAIWMTQDDERVCPVCGPLHETREEIWRDAFPWGSPAHPGCRCRTRYEVRGYGGKLS